MGTVAGYSDTIGTRGRSSLSSSRITVLPTPRPRAFAATATQVVPAALLDGVRQVDAERVALGDRVGAQDDPPVGRHLCCSLCPISGPALFSVASPRELSRNVGRTWKQYGSVARNLNRGTFARAAVEDAFADAQSRRCDLHELICGDEFDRRLDGELPGRLELDRFVRRVRPHVGFLFLFRWI